MNVIMPGRLVKIDLKDDDTMVMIGPIETCYVGYLPVFAWTDKKFDREK